MFGMRFVLGTSTGFLCGGLHNSTSTFIVVLIVRIVQAAERDLSCSTAGVDKLVVSDINANVTNAVSMTARGEED